jgi:hypothetical protein
MTAIIKRRFTSFLPSLAHCRDYERERRRDFKREHKDKVKAGLIKPCIRRAKLKQYSRREAVETMRHWLGLFDPRKIGKPLGLGYFFTA